MLCYLLIFSADAITLEKNVKKNLFLDTTLNINLTSHHFRLYILNSHFHKMGLFDILKNKHE